MSLRKPHARSMAAFGEPDKTHSPSGTRRVIPFPVQRSLEDSVFTRWYNGDTPKVISRALRVGESFIDGVIRERVTVLPKRAA